MSNECPFSYAKGEEPEPVEHKVIGICVHCKQEAFTLDKDGDKSCFYCAMADAC